MKVYSVTESFPAHSEIVLVHLTRKNWLHNGKAEGPHLWRVAWLEAADVTEYNEVPYKWNEFGPGGYYGQEVDLWCELPAAPSKPDQSAIVEDKEYRARRRLEKINLGVRFATINPGIQISVDRITWTGSNIDEVSEFLGGAVADNFYRDGDCLAVRGCGMPAAIGCVITKSMTVDFGVCSAAVLSRGDGNAEEHF